MTLDRYAEVELDDVKKGIRKLDPSNGYGAPTQPRQAELIERLKKQSPPGKESAWNGFSRAWSHCYRRGRDAARRRTFSSQPFHENRRAHGAHRARTGSLPRLFGRVRHPGKMLAINQLSGSFGDGPRFEYDEVRFLLTLLGAPCPTTMGEELGPVDLRISAE